MTKADSAPPPAISRATAASEGAAASPVISKVSSKADQDRLAAAQSAKAIALEQAAVETRLGDSYMQLGDYDKAISSFRIAQSLNPEDKQITRMMERARRAKAIEEKILR